MEVAPNAERITFHLSQKSNVKKYFRLEKPWRVVVDVPALQSGKSVGLSSAYRGSLLKDIRFGQFDPTTSRIVIDLKQSIAKPKVYVVPPKGDEPWRLVVDVAADKVAKQREVRSRQIATTPKPKAEAQVKVAPVMPKPLPKPQPPTVQRDPAATKAVADASARSVSKAYRDRKGSGQPSKEEYAFTPIPKPKPQTALQEDRKPVIVIDAGHGGKDRGAKGRGGIIEKDVTIQYAKALAEALRKTGRYHAALTRNADTFLFLKERVAVARKHRGDIFISLHADSNINPRAEGLSIYTVSEEASDAEAEALAAQENQSDVLGGIDLAHEDKIVADILIDLATRETRDKADILAETILKSMDAKIPLITRPHRFAGFRVLKAPDIPSVLIEVGFLTNSRDERRILTREYRDKVIRSIIRGLDTYFQGY